MASSNRHWPSLFKSKPINPTNQCHSSSNSKYTSGPDAERTSEPKPRWNPRPEQIRILESIFNSGTVNPPRDEIRKIRAQLQEYGQVGDANVFYWFQNRKSRSKNKRRHLQKPAASSSSSDKSSPTTLTSSTLLMDSLNSPTNSVNQPPFYQSNHEASFLHSSLGFCYPHQECVGNCSSVLDHHPLMNHGPLDHDHDQVDMVMKMPEQEIIATSDHQPIVPHILQGPDLGGRPPQKTTVFINDVCYEVATEPFNVREAFGDDAVLIQLPSGMPVLTNQMGLTQHPLQNGAFYYLLNPSPDHHANIDLV